METYSKALSMGIVDSHFFGKSFERAFSQPVK